MPPLPTECQPGEAAAQALPAASLAAVADAVRGDFARDPVARHHRCLRVLDTPDRQLQGRGLRLEAWPDSGGEQLRLMGSNGRLLAKAVLAAPAPRFADEFPEGRLRDQLVPVAGIRALLPGPWVQLTEETCALRDGDGKVRCRIVARRAGIEGGPARGSLSVRALKGYEADAEAVAGRVADAYPAAQDSEDPVAALADLLHPPQQGTAFPPVGDLHAAAAATLPPVLDALLDTVQHRADGVVADLDSEELHDLRVAVRRSRSILSLLKRAADHPELAFATDFFRWLGRVSGPTRDLDVHILDCKAHRRAADPELAADLEPLGRFLQSERDKAQADLVRILRGRRFGSGMRRWRRALAKADWPGADRPVGDLAERRIRKLYRRALREGREITPDAPAEALHALRKTMKKLRYVFEIVEPSYPKKPARQILKKLKELQQVLGDVQDSEVQAAALRQFGQAMSASGQADAPTLMAIGAQIEHLNEKRAAARARFAEAFAPVADAGFGERLHEICRTGRGPAA